MDAHSSKYWQDSYVKKKRALLLGVGIENDQSFRVWKIRLGVKHGKFSNFTHRKN